MTTKAMTTMTLVGLAMAAVLGGCSPVLQRPPEAGISKACLLASQSPTAPCPTAVPAKRFVAAAEPASADRDSRVSYDAAADAYRSSARLGR